MNNPIGGYIVVDLNGYNIAATTGSSTPAKVSREVVDALKQFNKPVLLKHFNLTIDGGSAEFEGFTAHTRTAGVHIHQCGNLININVTGDEQITVSVQ